MDLKQYFRKIREVEASISELYPLVVSLETSDGGKAGVMTEVGRYTAAKMVVEGTGVLAVEEQKEAYRQAHLSAKQAMEKSELAKRVQVAIITDPELQGHVPSRKSGK